MAKKRRARSSSAFPLSLFILLSSITTSISIFLVPRPVLMRLQTPLLCACRSCSWIGFYVCILPLKQSAVAITTLHPGVCFILSEFGVRRGEKHTSIYFRSDNCSQSRYFENQEYMMYMSLSFLSCIFFRLLKTKFLKYPDCKGTDDIKSIQR